MYLSSSYSSSSEKVDRREEFVGGGRVRRSVLVDNDLDHVVRFDSADFDLCDRVSVGLAGKVRMTAVSLSLSLCACSPHSVLLSLFFRPTR